MKWFLYAALAIAAMTAWVPAARAQNASGSIIGTVSDSTGAVVPGAQVTIKSVSTGLTQTLTTTGSGTYSVVSLEPGPSHRAGCHHLRAN